MSSTQGLRRLAALMLVVVGAVHLQQYADFIRDVPSIGELFLLNGAGAGVLVAMLAAPRLRLLGAVGGMALCAGSLVAISLSFTSGGILDYTETDLRAPIVIALAAEIIALAALVTVVTFDRR